MSLHIHQLEATHGKCHIHVPSITLQPSQIMGLIGPSGAGKTTLLLIIAGFIEARQGHITYQQQSMNLVPVEQRPIGIVFQQHNILEHLTIYENITLGLPKNLTKLEQKNAIEKALSYTHLQDFLHRYPYQLSGGQRSRVALTRALLMQRPILLLDEPFSALDPGLRADLIHDIYHIAQQQKIIIIITSHEPLGIEKYCDYFGYMQQGHLLYMDTPKNILHNHALTTYLYGQY